MIDAKALLKDSTPGPWHVDDIKEQKIRRTATGRSLAYVTPGIEVVGRGWKKRHEADKRLMAAGPDLAARVLALESALDSMIGMALVCHDFGLNDLYELEDLAYRDHRVLTPTATTSNTPGHL